MATKATDKNNDETTAKTPVASGEQTTSDKAPVETSTKVEDARSTDVSGGEVAGDVVYGDSGYSEAYGDDTDFEPLGHVREGEYDVPWAYLDAQDVRTSDTDDADVRAWNVQHTDANDDRTEGNPVALVPVQATPGQTFHVNELPNVDVMEKAGIDVAQFLSGLPVRADLGDDERPRRGIPA